jgi:hypothetical protein
LCAASGFDSSGFDQAEKARIFPTYCVLYGIESTPVLLSNNARDATSADASRSRDLLCAESVSVKSEPDVTSASFLVLS